MNIQNLIQRLRVLNPWHTIKQLRSDNDYLRVKLDDVRRELEFTEGLLWKESVKGRKAKPSKPKRKRK